MVKFPFEFIILKMFIVYTHFRENFLGNKNFRENEKKNFRETKFRAKICSFPLFAKMEKTVFVSTLVFCSYISGPASLINKVGRRCHLLPNNKWNLLPPFLSNEPSTGYALRVKVQRLTLINAYQSLSYFPLPIGTF
jgi:hypothetical protein